MSFRCKFAIINRGISLIYGKNFLYPFSGGLTAETLDRFNMTGKKYMDADESRPFPQMALEGRNALVVGLGVSGMAAAELLHKKGANVHVYDAKEMETHVHALIAQGIRAVPLDADEAAEKMDLIVTSPGVPPESGFLPGAKKAGVRIIGEMELASWFITCPMIAVSGTNGKSTVTTLIGRILEAHGFSTFTGGNLGVPLCVPAGADFSYDRIVAEVSSFQLDTISGFRPGISVLVNITEDHLDRYSSMEEYTRSKFRLFMNQDKRDDAVVNLGDPLIRKNVSIIPARVTGYELTRNGMHIEDRHGKNHEMEEMVNSLWKTSHLMGRHNLENLAASVIASCLAQASHDAVEKAVRDFRGLPHRLQYAGRTGDVCFYNDSKATNPDAVLRALEGFEPPVILIMGGRGKKGNNEHPFSILKDIVRQKVKKLVLLGETRFEIEKELGRFPEEGYVFAQDMEDAVEKALSCAGTKGSVLLSPATASFDMFESYAKRGEAFTKAVQARINTGKSPDFPAERN